MLARTHVLPQYTYGGTKGLLFDRQGSNLTWAHIPSLFWTQPYGSVTMAAGCV